MHAGVISRYDGIDGEMQVTLREMARAFNMSSAEFAEYVGYSRQNLYLALKGQNMATRRVRSVVRLLRVKAEELYQKDRATVERRKQMREMVMRFFEGRTTDGKAELERKG